MSCEYCGRDAHADEKGSCSYCGAPLKKAHKNTFPLEIHASIQEDHYEREMMLAERRVYEMIQAVPDEGISWRAWLFYVLIMLIGLAVGGIMALPIIGSVFG